MIARDLGRSVFELLSTVSSAELTQWVAFYKLEQDELERERKKHSGGR